MADPCFVIFEGGGAKGITHLGGLKALEAVGLARIGAAGTSAGAIVAALTAVGYDADELFRPLGDGNILADRKKTPIDLLGRPDWSQFTRFRGAKTTNAIVLSLGRVLFYLAILILALTPPLVPLWIFSLARSVGRPRVLGALWRVIDFFGFFSTDSARDLLNELLRDKLRARVTEDIPELICFRDIDPTRRTFCCALKIIATNLTHGRLDLFDQATDDVVVADAVAASFSIPIFFKPTRIRRVDLDGNVWVSEAVFADGGLVSNLPAWAFNEDKRAVERVPTNRGKHPIPIVAFTLGAAKPGEPGRSPLGALVSYIEGVLRAGVFGGQTVAEKFVPHLTVVALPSPLGVMQFDCDRTQAFLAYRAGFDAAFAHLRRTFQINPFYRTESLQVMLDVARARSRELRPGSVDEDEEHFRACLVRRLGNQSFKVVATVNMSDDTDDDLVLDQKNPGAPTAYKERDFTFVDLKAVDADVRMTKYEAALLRPGLASVISIPIFESEKEWTKSPRLRSLPVGVFCLDSGLKLDREFADQAFMRSLALQSVRFSGFMDFKGEIL